MKRAEDVVETAVKSLGKGFDLTSDFRLKFCKGDDRLVLLDDSHQRDLTVPGIVTLRNVSGDIKCDKGELTRYRSDILDFTKMSEYFNQRSSVSGKIPSGYFNVMFGFQSGSWGSDAANVKGLGMDGYFITLFDFHIDRPNRLRLIDDVRNAVPSSWDPPALARFIERYGTHIIVGISIGGQDVVLVKQDKSSDLHTSLLRHHLYSLSDQLFTGSCLLSSSSNNNNNNNKLKLPDAFNVFDDTQTVAFNNFTMNSKNGITVICGKRGGELQGAESHSEWLLTVPTKPDAINFNFIPITSLLRDVPGSGLLTHAISLYLRYKPPPGDLQYFLDFSWPKLWAPIHNDLPLGAAPNMPPSTSSPSPSLHFHLWGPKLYINTFPVITEKNPVTGMRLYLEGKKFNRLAIHLQHLSNTTTMLRDKIDDINFWQGSDQAPDHDRYFEPFNGKKFSHICTAPVKYNPHWSSTATATSVAFIVTGAQLHVSRHGSKSVLHLRLRFSKVSGYYIVQKDWALGSSGIGERSGIFSSIHLSLTGNNVHNNHHLVNKDKKEEAIILDSSVYPDGPPTRMNKMLKFVDLSQLCRGPQDNPGHWLVTGARLFLEKGKICLHVKFSLLNRFSPF